MSEFKHSFSDPFFPEIMDLGPIAKDQIIHKFQDIPWNMYISRMSESKGFEIFFSPSLEIENKRTYQGLSISAIGDGSLEEFYIFYKRPKKIKRLLGLIKQEDPDFTSEIVIQTQEEVVDLLRAFIDGNAKYLEKNIK